MYSVRTYIEEAVKDLRDAVAALHTEIHTIQTEAYRTEAQLANQVVTAQHERAELHAEAVVISDVIHKAALEARAKQLDTEAHAKGVEKSKVDADAARIVQMKNDTINRLESSIATLASLSSRLG